MSTPRFTPPSGPGGGDARRRDRGTRIVSRRMRGLVALAVAGTVGVGALAAQHSTPAGTATTSAGSSTTGAAAAASTLRSAASTPSSSASRTPVAASGGS